MKLLTAALAGLVFGLGLLLSGMTNPAKVLAFLDISGDWDPSLALVMAGALIPAFIAFRQVKRRQRTLLDLPIQLPNRHGIDRRLMIGALLFGLGWGIAGYCPGPATASLLGGTWQAPVFVAAMLAGMAFYAWLNKRAH